MERKGDDSDCLITMEEREKGSKYICDHFNKGRGEGIPYYRQHLSVKCKKGGGGGGGWGGGDNN